MEGLWAAPAISKACTRSLSAINHLTKYLSEISSTEDDESYEGAGMPKRHGRRDAVQPVGGRSMGKNGQSETGASSGDQNSTENMAYGCLFCITGKEQSVVDHIQASCPDVRAITMRKTKYRTCKKVKHTEEAIVLPSHVFFQAPSYIDPALVFPRENVIRTLSMNGNWRLSGADERFVRWLFRYEGLLSLSQAYREGDRIRIVSGPLKDMEGRIRRIDKRGLSGQVILSFNGRDILIWLEFELVEPIEIRSESASK